MPKRKNIRLTLKPSDAEAFEAAKMKAENESGYTMRDGEFAAKTIIQAIKAESRTLTIKVDDGVPSVESIIKSIKEWANGETK